MEPYTDKLEELIELKKNKGHKITKKESEEFASAWSELIAAEGGFSKTAEQYFYDGFIFAGAKPFVRWVLLSDDQFFALDALFKGSLFEKDTALTFRVLISTLAQILKEKATEKNLVCPLIKRIPKYSKTKKNKTIGNGHQVVLKYFVSEIDDISVLPLLSELDLKPVYVNSFVAVFDELLSRLNVNTLSKKEVETLTAVNLWLHPNAVAGDQSKAEAEPEQPESEGQNSEPSASADQKVQDSPDMNQNPYEQLINILNEAIVLSGNLRNTSKSSERKYVVLQETIGSLQREVETLNAQLKAAMQRESTLDEQLADRNNQIADQNLKIKSLEENIQKMASEIEAKDSEIGERIKMIDALSRDRAKQSDEQLHRLASKLKVEYRDFRDAETLTMDCDLGENMREQLKNVFSILIKAGIALD